MKPPTFCRAYLQVGCRWQLQIHTTLHQMFEPMRKKMGIKNVLQENKSAGFRLDCPFKWQSFGVKTDV